MSETIGFIGLGAMGGPMVRRLLEHGFGLVAYDVDQGALSRAGQGGAVIAESATDVASRAEIVLVSLPTPDVVRRVALGDKGIAEGSKVEVYVDLSTTGPRVAVEVAEGLKERNIIPMDAPVSGGIGGAEKGTLAVMVSGDRATWERVRPVLEIIGKNAFFVGEGAGQGQTMKLITNMVSATAMAVSCEAFAMGAKAGLDPDIMVDVINAGSGANTAVRDKFPKAILPRTFDFGFRTELMYKDVKLCLEEAETLGVPMWVANAAKQWWSYAYARGGKTEDFTSLMRYVEEQAGVTVRGKRNEPRGTG